MDTDSHGFTFWMGFLTSFLLFTVIILNMDTIVRPEEYYHASTKCEKNDGMKYFSFDVKYRTVVCNDGAIFEYDKNEIKK